MISDSLLDDVVEKRLNVFCVVFVLLINSTDVFGMCVDRCF